MIVDGIILMISILGGLFIGFIFTDVIQAIHLMIVGGFFGMFFLFYILYKIKSGTGFGSAGSSRSVISSGRIESPMEAINVVNEKLKHYRSWEEIQVDAEYTKGSRKKIVNKKNRDLEPHWAILSEMKRSKLPVLIIYSEHEDVIVDYDPVPPALRRDDMFKDFDPIQLERMMSRGYNEEEEEDEEQKVGQFEMNINDNRAEEEEDGGWF